MLNHHLKPLHAETLAALRDYYRDMAAQCSDLEAIKSRRHERKELQGRKAALLSAAARVKRLGADIPEEQAVAAVAEATGLPRETVAANVAQIRRLTEQARRFQRDREIMALARRGHHNAEIGRRVKLHPGTVSRIIQAALRAGDGR